MMFLNFQCHLGVSKEYDWQQILWFLLTLCLCVLFLSPGMVVVLVFAPPVHTPLPCPAVQGVRQAGGDQPNLHPSRFAVGLHAATLDGARIQPPHQVCPIHSVHCVKIIHCLCFFKQYTGGIWYPQFFFLPISQGFFSSLVLHQFLGFKPFFLFQLGSNSLRFIDSAFCPEFYLRQKFAPFLSFLYFWTKNQYFGLIWSKSVNISVVK